MVRALLIVLALLASRSFCQQHEIDSLQKALPAAADSQKVQMLNDLSWYYKAIGSFDTAALCAQRAGALAAKLGDSKGLYVSYNNLGSARMYQSNYAEALKNYFACLRLQEEILPNGKARASEKSIATCYNNIGNVYFLQRNYPQALSYHLKSMQVREKTGDKRGMADSYNNIGLVYDGMGDREKALQYFRRCLEHYLEMEDARGISTSYQNIGSVHGAAGRNRLAIENYQAALSIQQEVDDQQGMATSYANLGTAYAHLRSFSEAKQYLLKSLALARQLGDLETVKEVSHNLSKVYDTTGNYTEALACYKAYVRVRDSISNEENTKKQVRLEMNYNFEKKEAAQRLEQEKKDAIAAAESKRQKIVLFSVSGLGLLVLGFAVFAWRSFLQKKRANEEISRQKNLIEEKQKEILDSIHYARRIQRSLMPTDQYLIKCLTRRR
jgi:tetratricopeptide (TPR) repeat protein